MHVRIKNTHQIVHFPSKRSFNTQFLLLLLRNRRSYAQIHPTPPRLFPLTFRHSHITLQMKLWLLAGKCSACTKSSSSVCSKHSEAPAKKERGREKKKKEKKEKKEEWNDFYSVIVQTAVEADCPETRTPICSSLHLVERRHKGSDVIVSRDT